MVACSGEHLTLTVVSSKATWVRGRVRAGAGVRAVVGVRAGVGFGSSKAASSVTQPRVGFHTSLRGALWCVYDASKRSNSCFTWVRVVEGEG